MISEDFLLLLNTKKIYFEECLSSWIKTDRNMEQFCFELLVILKSNFLTLLGRSLVNNILCQQVVVLVRLEVDL